jgi:hypothetical protein
MTAVYPGFVTALFVHLIDSILYLEQASWVDTCDGDQFVQILIKWVYYILSRAFHMHFDRSVALFASNEAVEQYQEHQQQLAPGKSLQLPQSPDPRDEMTKKSSPRLVIVDLKKRGRKKWNGAQLRYMQSPLKFSSLDDIGFPLNSVCDRLLSFQQQNTSTNIRKTTSSAVMRLYQYLEDVIGEKDRVVFMGLHNYQKLRSETNVVVHIDGVNHSADNENESKKNNEGEDSQEVFQTKLRPGGVESAKVKTILRSIPARNMTAMSLEDMEAMLVGGCCNAEVDVDDDITCAIFPDKDNIVSCCPSGLNEKSNFVAPWTLCERWDSCAIGAMPGYPS